MSKIDWIVGSSIIIYFANVITEIVSSVPVGITQSDFGGNCILWAHADYNPNGTYTVTSYGDSGLCGFCTYLTIFTVLYSFIYGSYSAYALYKSADNGKEMWVLPAIMVCLLFFVLKFASSCLLSIGISSFCSNLKKQVETCKEGQNANWFYKWGETTTSNYYTNLTTAQSASWFCVFEWLLLFGLALLHYRRNIRLRSQGTSQTAEGFGSSDTTGIVANEILPG